MHAADGSGDDVPLAGTARISATNPDWSTTGTLLFTDSSAPATNSDLLTTTPTSGGVAVFLRTKHAEGSGGFSPDGRWVAYASNASGRREVYVRPFPGANPVYTVSVEGGDFPRWRGDGRELYFLAPDGLMMAATTDASHGFVAGVPRPLFPTTLTEVVHNHPYAVTKDGRRFLLPRPRATPLAVLMDWRGALPR